MLGNTFFPLTLTDADSRYVAKRVPPLAMRTC